MFLILTLSLICLNAQATQYVVHVNHTATIQPNHSILNSLLQKEITIDTTAKTVKVRLSQECTLSNICPEMLRVYTLKLKKMNSSIIQAEGMLPLPVGPLQTPGVTLITMEKNLDHATAITIHDQNGTSTLIASPLEVSNLLF